MAEGRSRPPQPAELTPAEEYERRFGSPPHHRMKLETILERLANDDAPDGSLELRETTRTR